MYKWHLDPQELSWDYNYSLEKRLHFATIRFKKQQRPNINLYTCEALHSLSRNFIHLFQPPFIHSREPRKAAPQPSPLLMRRTKWTEGPSATEALTQASYHKPSAFPLMPRDLSMCHPHNSSWNGQWPEQDWLQRCLRRGSYRSRMQSWEAHKPWPSDVLKSLEAVRSIDGLFPNVSATGVWAGAWEFAFLISS